MTRLSSSLPARTLSFRWKTQSTLCLSSSLKEREWPIRAWTRNKKHSVEVPDACPRDIFPNMNSLLRALLTLPMITCTVERLFSAVNRMKTGTRATMLTDRLNSLSLLSFERELTDSLEYQEILAVFSTRPRRLLPSAPRPTSKFEVNCVHLWLFICYLGLLCCCLDG